MKNKSTFIACLLLVIVCFGTMTSCDDDVLYGGGKSQDKVIQTGPWAVEDITESPEGVEWSSDAGGVMEGRLYFHVSDTEALLIDSAGSLTWLYSENKTIFNGFGSGDYVRVSHGYIMESYPAQTYISRIALVEDGDVSSITDEEWERLEGVFVGLERE